MTCIAFTWRCCLEILQPARSATQHQQTLGANSCSMTKTSGDVKPVGELLKTWVMVVSPVAHVPRVAPASKKTSGWTMVMSRAARRASRISTCADSEGKQCFCSTLRPRRSAVAAGTARRRPLLPRGGAADSPGRGRDRRGAWRGIRGGRREMSSDGNNALLLLRRRGAWCSGGVKRRTTRSPSSGGGAARCGGGVLLL